MTDGTENGRRIPAPSPIFYCDNNVHRLGRSLRMLGYDTLCFGAGPDAELRALRDQTGRILLSRDSDFEGETNSLVVTSDLYMEQLKTVIVAFDLDIHTYRYSLCLECNRPIQRVKIEEHAEEAPEWLSTQNEPLWQCPDCKRLFCAGSHLNHMNDRFDNLLDRDRG